MTDIEFDIMDELYFVQPFPYLLDVLEIEEASLKEHLAVLIDKGWVKCFLDNTEEVFKEDLDLERYFRDYSYLATKQGLLAHNADD